MPGSDRPDCERLNRAIDYRFDDPALLEQALTHRSAGASNYERLEFLGDSVLELVISDHLFRRFAGAHEGQLTRIRATIVREPTLSRVARSLDLGSFLKLGGGELKSGGFNRDSILADALEAVIGALYLDGGMRAASAFINTQFAEQLATVNPDHVRKDPKTLLQEHLQRHALDLPEYEVEQISGASHDQRFVVRCRIVGMAESFRGEGSSKRRAEQHAAAAALESFSTRRATPVENHRSKA